MVKKFLVSVFLLVSVLTLGAIKGQRLDSGQEYEFAFTEATRHYLFGNYVQAVNLYKECIRLRPGSAAAHFQLSKVYLNAGNIALAREYAKKASEFSPDNKWYLQTLGDVYQMEEKFDSSIMAYNKLLTIDKDNVNIMFAIATLYEKNKDYEKALQSLDMIDSRIGISKEVSMAKYRILEAQNKPQKAIQALKAAGSLGEDEYALTGMIAEFYQRHSMPDSALLYYRQIYPAFKSDANVVFSYAGFLVETGKTDSAKLILVDVMTDTSVDRMTKTAFFFNALRDEENFRRSSPVMEPVTRAYIKGYEGDIRSLSVFADVFLRLRKFEDARWALVRIVDSDKSNYPALEQLIYTLNILGSSDSVLIYTDKALQIEQNKPVLFLFRGSANYQKKEYATAIKDLEKGLAVASDNALKLEFYSLLAECYQQTDQFEASERCFKDALAIDKNNPGIRNNYAYYLSLREKELKYAQKLSKATVETEPENSTYLDTYAWILYKMGKVREAKKYIMKAIEYGGRENDVILSHGADILIELGEYSEALKYLDKIIAYPESEESPKARERIREVQSLMKR